jgi:hypothetical protein
VIDDYKLQIANYKSHEENYKQVCVKEGCSLSQRFQAVAGLCHPDTAHPWVVEDAEVGLLAPRDPAHHLFGDVPAEFGAARREGIL